MQKVHFCSQLPLRSSHPFQDNECHKGNWGVLELVAYHLGLHALHLNCEGSSKPHWVRR
jgi:hypothetical protein